MGTDIHCLAEVQGDDGVWRALGEVFPHPYYKPDEPTTYFLPGDERDATPREVDYSDATAVAAAREEIIRERMKAGDSREEAEEWVWFQNEPLTSDPIYERNYVLFSVLAGVRNGRGFAGVVTGAALKPIDEPRGVPADASPEWLKVVEHWGPDLHSESWVTAQELGAYDWDQPREIVGVLSESQFLHCRRTGEQPEDWCGWISGPGIRIVTAKEYDALAARALPAGTSDAGGKEISPILNEEIYVHVAWTRPLREQISAHFLEKTLPALLAQHEDPTRVRIVFGFDN